MADKSHQYGEGANSSTNNATNTGGKHIDALEVESLNNSNNARNGGTMRVTFNQASSFSFIMSLTLYMWYMVQAMSTFSRETFRVNQYKVLYGEDWNNDDDSYETYMILFLIASIVFILSTLIQIYVWFAKIFGRNLNDMYGTICLSNVFLSFAGCICQAIAIGMLESDTVGEVNMDNQSDSQIVRITCLELLYGGFLVVSALYNVYFTSLLFPAVHKNQFIRLGIECGILIANCACYAPFFVKEASDAADLADEYGDYDDSDYYSNRDYDEFYSNLAGAFGVAAAGLLLIIVACLCIIGYNILNYRNHEEVRKISQLTSKSVYIKCIMALVVGLILYVVGYSLGSSWSYYFWWYYLEIQSGIPFYIFFGAIVVIADVCFCYYVV